MSSRRIWKVAVVVAALALTGCSDWLLPGFGAGHTRYNPAESSLTVDNVDELQQAWSIGAGSPLVAGDRAYVMTSTDTSVGLRALDLATGATVWDRTVASNMPIPWFKSVAFSGGELWIAHIASDFTFKITAVDPATGDILRALPTGLPITSVVSDGDRAVWIDVASPEPTQPARLQVLDRLSLTPAWSYTFPGDTNQVGSSSFTPSLRDGKIFVAGAQVLYAFDSAGCGSPSCEPLWTLPLGRMSTPIAGHDGPLFVVAHGEGTVHGQPTSWSTLWALVADTGAESWSVAYSGLSSDPFSPASGGITSVAVAGGTAYVLGFREDPPDPNENTLTAFHPDGSCTLRGCAVWAADVDGSVVTVAGGVVYVGGDGFVKTYAAAGCGAAVCPALTTIDVTGEVQDVVVARGKVLVNASDTLTAFALP